MARFIAFYLPQYHPTSVNDKYWGKGFTEWTNVAKAKPLFRGHHQPHIPADLGFYDLRLPIVREQQAELAREAGIEGFCYWHYWFGNGKQILEKPFEEVLKTGRPDFPFCLGWANHSWQTKTWKRDASLKEGKTMIMEQLYDGEKQYIDHFMYNLPAFKDRRYITIECKPVFVIWNPLDHSEQISLLIKTWRRLAKENGLRDIYFIGRQSLGDTVERILNMGFDGVYQERTANALNQGKKNTLWYRIRYSVQLKFGIQLGLNKHDFKECYRYLLSKEAQRENIFPTMVAGYDRSPRAGNKAQLFYNFTPETWQNHVKDALALVSGKDYEHRVVFLKSWNEWGESNYMEPDIKYGSALLDVLKKELE